MNEKRREAYLTLIESLLTCPSDEETAILQANLELLDEEFAGYLREWATQTLGNLDADQAYNGANILYGLNITFSSFQQGSRASNIEIAIACLDMGLTIFTRAAYSQDWAMFQNSLGIKYSDRIKGERGDNLERAIAFYEAALQVRTRDAFPQDWATTQENLAYAYQEKGLISEAIKYFKSSLEIFKPDALPLSCLKAARNLGNIAFDIEQWETAIFGYEKAIEAVEQSREWVTSDRHKRELIANNLEVYEKMMQSCINHQQYHKAIQTVERSKSRYLVELFTNSEIYPKTATETEKQQLRNLRRQIAALRQSLETETPIHQHETEDSNTLSPPLSKEKPGAVPKHPNTQRATQTRTQSPEAFQQQTDSLTTALQQLEQLLQQIKQREPEFTLTQKIEPIDIIKFQQTLDPKTAIIEWYIGNSPEGGRGGGFVFVITREKIHQIPITSARTTELETWQKQYLEQYRSPTQNKIWKQTLPAKLQKLSQILQLNQIVANIPKHCNQLILIPHRYLHLFPLHALPFTLEDDRANAPAKCLLDCFPEGVKYSPSLQLLQLVQNRSKTRTSPPL